MDNTETKAAETTVAETPVETKPVEQVVEQPTEKPVEPQPQETEEPGAMDDLFRPDTEVQETQGGQEPQTPEVYEFKTPDGQALSAEDQEAFSSVAKDLKLSQEQAQKLFDSAMPQIGKIFEQRSMQSLKQSQALWKKALAADQELGGSNMEQTKLNVGRFLTNYATPEFKQLMANTGLQNHPEIVRVMARIGSALGNDAKFINGQSASSVQKTSPLKNLYDNSPELKF